MVKMNTYPDYLISTSQILVELLQLFYSFRIIDSNTLRGDRVLSTENVIKEMPFILFKEVIHA